MTELRDELWVRSPTGVLQAGGVRVTSVDWALEDNTFGVLRASGPLEDAATRDAEGLDPAWLVLDARFEVHRYLDGRDLGMEGDTQFFLRYWWFGEDDAGAATWNIEAYSLEYALTGRMIDSYASTSTVTNPLTTKTGKADDLMKAYVRENIGALTALAARKNTELSVDPDLGAGPATTKSASYDELLSVLVDLANDAEKQGTRIVFGIVYTASAASLAPTGYTFRTWTGQRGVNHTASSGDPVIVSKDNENLAAPKVEYDHRQELTAMRALGRGEGADRKTIRVEDTTRSAASVWAYREGKADTQAETDDALTSDANAELNRAHGIKTFTGKMIDTDYARYGQRVKFGDLVTVKYLTYSFDCRLSVRGRWQKDGGEQLELTLTGLVTL